MDTEIPGPGRDDADRCRYFQDLFSPYIHGDLEATDRRALADHIRDCEPCSEKFGLSWKAIGSVVGSPMRMSRGGSKRSRRTIRAWLPLGLVLLALILLWSSGITGSGRRLSDIIGKQGQGGTTQTMAEIVDVLYKMLRVATDPPPGSTRVSAVAKAEMRGFFLDLEDAGKTRNMEEISFLFHPLFRAVDNRADGRDWSRDEFLLDIDRNGLPDILPVSVNNASSNEIYLSLAWGKRAANAILLRKEPEKRGRNPNGFKLAYLLFTR